MIYVLMKDKSWAEGLSLEKDSLYLILPIGDNRQNPALADAGRAHPTMRLLLDDSKFSHSSDLAFYYIAIFIEHHVANSKVHPQETPDPTELYSSAFIITSSITIS